MFFDNFRILKFNASKIGTYLVALICSIQTNIGEVLQNSENEDKTAVVAAARVATEWLWQTGRSSVHYTTGNTRTEGI